MNNYDLLKIKSLIEIFDKIDIIEYHYFIKHLKDKHIEFYQFLNVVKNNNKIMKKIIEMFNYNYDFFSKTIDKIESTFIMNNHTKKYSHEYYLINILSMLNKNNQWSSLKYNSIYDSTYKNHYKSIYKKFLLYTKKKIFENVFVDSSNNNFVLSNNNLLIDACSFSNKYGSENVSVNCEYTKKNCTKVSFITNTDKIFLSVTPFNINNKEINYNDIKEHKQYKIKLKQDKKNKLKLINKENKELNKKIKKLERNDFKSKEKMSIDKIPIKVVPLNKIFDNITPDNDVYINNISINNNSINKIVNEQTKNNKNQIIHTTIHDVMTIQTSLNNIKVKFNESSQLTLTGDLGYLSLKEYTFNNNKIKLITPLRKNQKKILTEKEKKSLKTRYKIENGFSLLKQNERLMVRKDRNMKSFISFVFISCSIENYKILKSKKINQ